MFDSKIKLSDLQIQLMKILWMHEKLPASEVHRLVNEQKELAPTTVATLLKRLQEKGCVDHEKQGRQFLYFAKVSEEEVKKSMLGSMLQNLFDGSPEQLVHHLVGQEDVKKSDLDKIHALLEKGKDHE